MYKIQKPGAWICSNDNDHQNRGRLKVHQPGSKIYLNNDDEFEIELHNPTTNNVKAEITIDGKPISSGGIVIRSGERIYLECFPDSRKKFTFKTYEVSDDSETKKAISHNGSVQVKFYKELIKKTYCEPFPFQTQIFYNTNLQPLGNNFYTSNVNTYGTTDVGSSYLSTSEITSSMSNSELSIETGQVDGGSQSNQQFSKVDMDFESGVSYTYSFKLLPMSQKPLDKKEFKVKKSKKSKSLSTTDKLDSLIKLSDLYKSGMINKFEFDKLKSELV